MLSLREIRGAAFALIALAVLAFCGAPGNAQAALLLEEPYGFFGTVNPTGHIAIYFDRVCAATPVKLRRCEPGERGAVISRYQGIDGYDWVAMPLVPYLYSVENESQVPAHVSRDQVRRLRGSYRESHLLDLSGNLPEGGLVRGGWTQLVGAAYERRIYAFRFETTPEQDDALIARMNCGKELARTFSFCLTTALILLAHDTQYVLPPHVQPQRLSRRRHDHSQADHLQAGAVCPQAS